MKRHMMVQGTEEWFRVRAGIPTASEVDVLVTAAGQISKGKGAIELAHANDLIATLETLKDAVLGGELDAQLEAVSGAVKAGFKK